MTEDTKLIIAGLLGGLVSLAYLEKTPLFDKFVAIIGGGSMAYFLTTPVILYFNLSQNYSGGIGFFLGMFGLTIGNNIIKKIRHIDMKGFF